MVRDQAELTPDVLAEDVRKLAANAEQMRARMETEPSGNGLEKVLAIIEENAKK